MLQVDRYESRMFHGVDGWNLRVTELQSRIVIETGSGAPARIVISVNMLPRLTSMSETFPGMLHVSQVKMQSTDARFLIKELVGGVDPKFESVVIGSRALDSSGQPRYPHFQIKLRRTETVAEMQVMLQEMHRALTAVIARSRRYNRGLANAQESFINVHLSVKTKASLKRFSESVKSVTRLGEELQQSVRKNIEIAHQAQALLQQASVMQSQNNVTGLRQLATRAERKIRDCL